MNPKSNSTNLRHEKVPYFQKNTKDPHQFFKNRVMSSQETLSLLKGATKSSPQAKQTGSPTYSCIQARALVQQSRIWLYHNLLKYTVPLHSNSHNRQVLHKENVKYPIIHTRSMQLARESLKNCL